MPKNAPKTKVVTWDVQPVLAVEPWTRPAERGCRFEVLSEVGDEAGGKTGAHLEKGDDPPANVVEEDLAMDLLLPEWIQELGIPMGIVGIIPGRADEPTRIP